MEKVNEFMKANGRCELNMEEADQVVGGLITSIHQCTCEDDINNYVFVFLASMEKAFGKDITLDYIKKDWPSSDAISEYKYGDLDCLHNLLCQKWIDRQFTKYPW